MSGTQNNVATETYSSEYLGDGGRYAITGGVSVIPRYNNSTITITENADVKLNGITNCYIDSSDSQVEFNGAENTTAYITNGNTTINSALNSNFMITGSPTTVSGGSNNFISTDSTLLFSGGTGYNSIIGNGPAYVFAADGLNLDLRSLDASSLFVAGEGNETLNGAGSSAAIAVYASQISDHNTNLVATTGSGDDALNAGTGNSTLNGGTGNNLFIFNKDTDAGGRTVIGDFSASSGNRISLYGYNLTQDSLNSLLANSHNDSNGNAILNLENHQITVQGVSISDLHTQQFNI